MTIDNATYEACFGPIDEFEGLDFRADAEALTLDDLRRRCRARRNLLRNAHGFDNPLDALVERGVPARVKKLVRELRADETVAARRWSEEREAERAAALVVEDLTHGLF